MFPFRRPLLAVALLLLLLPVAASDAAAQCAMCGTTAGEAADAADGNGALAAGILLLLVPALTMLGVVGLLLWRHRNGGQAYGGSPEAHDTVPTPRALSR